MENARCQNRIGMTLKQYLGHVFPRSCAATGHHGHTYGLTNAPRDR